MPMPKDVGIVDTMIGIPSPNQPATYDFMRPLFRDKQSLDQFDFPSNTCSRTCRRPGLTRTTSSSPSRRWTSSASRRG